MDVKDKLVTVEELGDAIERSTAIPKVAFTRIMGNGSAYYETTPTAIDGYVPVCICGYTSIGSYHVTDDLYDFYYDSNSGKIVMNFVSAKTLDVGLNVSMLYVKS